MNRILTIAITLLALSLSEFAQTPTPAAATDNTPVPVPKSAADTETAPVNSTTGLQSKPVINVPNPGYVRKDAPAAIPKFDAPPVIDGNLNDAVWRNAAVFGDFLQTQPGDNVQPSSPTEVLIGYDSKNLYIAFRAKPGRDKIRATVGRRDNVFSDDFVGMYLDTFNDQRQAYFIFLNPLGIQGDGTF